MSGPLLSRFMRAFGKGIWGQLADKIVEVCAIVVVILRISVTTGFSVTRLVEGRWEVVAEGVWTVCGLVVWHAFRSAYAVAKEVFQEEQQANSTAPRLLKVVSASGQPLYRDTPVVRAYSYPRAKLYGSAIFLTGVVTIVSALAWQKSQGAKPKSDEVVDVDRKQQSPVPVEELHAQFKFQFLNMSRRLDLAPWWVLYDSGFGKTISPVALLTFLEVSSSFSHPVSISSYAMEFESYKCPHLKLQAMDTRTKQLLWGYMGVDKAPMVALNNSLNISWEQPIPAYGTQRGILVFDNSSKCDVGYGDQVRFQLTLTDSFGITHPPLVSQEFIVSRDFPTDRSVQAVDVPLLEFPGYSVDASKAYRKLFSDPVGVVPPAELNKGTVQIAPDQHRGKIGLVSGITTICACMEAKKK